MSLRDTLVSQLENEEIIDDRYTELECINYDPNEPESKTGNFSLIFRARDTVEDKLVALKFFDPECLALNYRLQAFDREPVLLRKVKGKKRCLQLLSPLSQYSINVKSAAGDDVAVPCKYFVTEWLEDEIQGIFETQQDFDSIVKLQLFRQIVLGVSALHRNGIFHRDAKKENTRGTEEGGQPMIKIIDMGAAACFEHPPIKEAYENAPGDLRYSSPEALFGFCSIRSLSKYTDFYSLGCLLYELFHHHMYFVSFQKLPNNLRALTLASQAINNESTDNEKLETWHRCLDKFKHLFTLPELGDSLSTAPGSVSRLLNELINDLTLVDYRVRLTDFDAIMSRVDTMLKVLNDLRLQKIERNRKRLWKQKRLEKLARKNKIESPPKIAEKAVSYV